MNIEQRLAALERSAGVWRAVAIAALAGLLLMAAAPSADVVRAKQLILEGDKGDSVSFSLVDEADKGLVRLVIRGGQEGDAKAGRVEAGFGAIATTLTVRRDAEGPAAPAASLFAALDHSSVSVNTGINGAWLNSYSHKVNLRLHTGDVGGNLENYQGSIRLTETTKNLKEKLLLPAK